MNREKTADSRPDPAFMLCCHTLKSALDLSRRNRVSCKPPCRNPSQDGCVARPAEHGPGRGEGAPAVTVDLAARNLGALADLLL